jgi:hypothetical protein
MKNIAAKDSRLFFYCGMSHSTNTYTHTRTSTHPFEYTYAHPTPINISKKLDRLDLEIYKVGQRMSRCQRRRRLSLKE